MRQRVLGWISAGVGLLALLLGPAMAIGKPEGAFIAVPICLLGLLMIPLGIAMDLKSRKKASEADDNEEDDRPRRRRKRKPVRARRSRRDD